MAFRACVADKTAGDHSFGIGGGPASILNNSRRIAELKKKVALAEGQRKAYTSDWSQRIQHTTDAQRELKRDIRRLTAQLLQLNNANSAAGRRTAATKRQKCNDIASVAAASVAANSDHLPAIDYPVGARTAAEAVIVYDQQHCNARKRLDRLRAFHQQRVLRMDQLRERYQQLLMTISSKPPPPRERPKTAPTRKPCNPLAATPTIPATQQAAVNDAASSSTSSSNSGAATTLPNINAAPSANATATTTQLELDMRQQIARLENDIHRTQVQCTEAEHIRKKYRTIDAALRHDAERFERTLRQLATAQLEQDSEIEAMQRTHHEAQHLRDGSKVALVRQEHSVQGAARQRERQAQDCRRQVEERRTELERLERRLFAAGPTTARLNAPASAVAGKSASTSERRRRSSADDSGQNDGGGADGGGDEKDASDGGGGNDRSVGERGQSVGERGQQQRLQRMQELFRGLMEQTGATTAPEVLQRYLAQRESGTRLGYLRTCAETEKRRLESERERLGEVLEASKFMAGVKETDENQEDVEQLKLALIEQNTLMASYASATEHSGHVIDAIQQALLDLILMLQEVDEFIDDDGAGGGVRRRRTASTEADGDGDFELADLLSGNVDDVQLLRILEDKFRKGIAWCDNHATDQRAEDNANVDDKNLLDGIRPRMEDLQLQPPASPPSVSRAPTSALDERERPQAFPSCYSSLMVAGRLSSSIGGAASVGIGGAGGAVSVTPGQMSQSTITDDEAEVPTRGYIKRQAQNIVDVKSRRKGFRAPKR